MNTNNLQPIFKEIIDGLLDKRVENRIEVEISFNAILPFFRKSKSGKNNIGTISIYSNWLTIFANSLTSLSMCLRLCLMVMIVIQKQVKLSTF
jgi:hypothetical protein